jgi:SAM-dependent methyltransferase
MSIKYWLRDLFYPGLDLHVRNRASLCPFWRTGPRSVLDAGSGNGYFAWRAYLSGASVVAMNFEAGQVQKATEYLVGHRKADPQRLRFEQCNLYDLDKEKRSFDEIICYETLEHIRRDEDVVRELARILKPGGALHLCCPNRLHPRHMREVLDLEETGGHYRAGYTIEEFRKLLEPLGLVVDQQAGIGPSSLYWADEIIRRVKSTLGDIVALPLLPLLMPFVWAAKMNPEVPFSIYVRAIKPTSAQSVSGT